MIKKRNLDASLIQWIQMQTNIPLAIMGDIFYVAPAAASTSQFRTALEDLGIDSGNIYTTLAAAEDAAVTRRNDVIIMAPGSYATTAALTWDKDNVHLIGAGLGLPHTDNYLTQGMPLVYTTTAQVANVINLTGERNSFHNVVFQNSGNHASNVAAVTVNGYGNNFYNCGFQGIMAANQRSTVGCCSLEIAAGGFYSFFDSCLIGQAEWGTRTTAYQGHLYFSGNTSSSMPSHGHFNNCVFRSHAQTATIPMVRVRGPYGCNYYWRYTNCMFYNIWTNFTDKCSVVFYYTDTNPVNTQHHVMESCTAVGYDEWQSKDTGEWVCGAMPITGDGGGLAELLDEAVES